MFRGQQIARFLMEKEKLDNHLLTGDHPEWYIIDRTTVTSRVLKKFNQFYMDEDVKTFLNNSLDTSNSLCLQVCYALFTSLLSVGLAKTSINGILGRGSMHLFSFNQLQEFLDIPTEWVSYDKRLLELGAGDGQITAIMAQLYRSVSVTEASKIMEWRLKQRGFKVVPLDGWNHIGTYHLVSALNLLDRHYNPSLLLTQLHTMTLRSQCLLLLAVVLPLHQFVEFHPTNETNRPSSIQRFSELIPKLRLKVICDMSHRCDTKISIKGRTFEEQADSLVADVLEPAGFELLKWSKLPYLSEGDLKRPFYHLDDALFLLKPVNISSIEGNSLDVLSNNSMRNCDFTAL